MERFQKPSLSYVLDSVLQINWIVPLVWHCAPLQLRHVQLKNHIPNNNWIVVMAVIRLSNVWWCQFQFFFNFAQIWPSPRGKKSENVYNSAIIFYLVTFTSSYWKWDLYQQGTTAVCNKTSTEPSFLAARKWFNQLNFSLTG